MLLSTVTINYIVRTTQLFKIVATTNHILMHSRSPQEVLPRAELAEIPNKEIYFEKKILDSDDLLIKVYNAESKDEDHNATKICDEKTTTS